MPFLLQEALLVDGLLQKFEHKHHELKSQGCFRLPQFDTNAPPASQMVVPAMQQHDMEAQKNRQRSGR